MWILLLVLVVPGEWHDNTWLEAETKTECVSMGETRKRFFKDDPTTMILYECVQVVGKAPPRPVR